jgi:hypothetical protein
MGVRVSPQFIAAMASSDSIAFEGTAAVLAPEFLGGLVAVGIIAMGVIAVQALIPVISPIKGKGSSSTGTRTKPRINQKQGRHIPGSKNYKPGRSILTANPEILAEEAGTGEQAGNIPRGEPGFKERIDFKRPIGLYFDRTTGTYQSTTKAIFHYAGDGSIHIIPVRP